MGIHVTKYETTDGKTRKVADAKASNGAPAKSDGADSKNQQAGNAGKGAVNGQGA